MVTERRHDIRRAQGARARRAVEEQGMLLHHSTDVAARRDASRAAARRVMTPAETVTSLPADVAVMTISSRRAYSSDRLALMEAAR